MTKRPDWIYKKNKVLKKLLHVKGAEVCQIGCYESLCSLLPGPTWLEERAVNHSALNDPRWAWLD